jgi:hypothetical protein
MPPIHVLQYDVYDVWGYLQTWIRSTHQEMVLRPTLHHAPNRTRAAAMADAGSSYDGAQLLQTMDWRRPRLTDEGGGELWSRLSFAPVMKWGEKSEISRCCHEYQITWARLAICTLPLEITTCILHPPCISTNACPICTMRVGLSLRTGRPDWEGPYHTILLFLAKDIFVSASQLSFSVEKPRSQKQEQTVNFLTGFWNAEKQVSEEIK